MLIPTPPPADDDQPATRRDLAQLRELLISMMQAQAAELRTEIADRSVTQIRWLVGALSVWGVILAVLDRLP